MDKMAFAPQAVSIAQELSDSVREREDIQLNMAESKSERADSIEIYMQWRRKLEYLEVRYADIISPHYQESAAKRRSEVPKDSLNAIIDELAEAYYNTGYYSTDKLERRAMLDKLQELTLKSDTSGLKVIESYINRLEAATK